MMSMIPQLMRMVNYGGGRHAPRRIKPVAREALKFKRQTPAATLREAAPASVPTASGLR